MSVVWCQEKSNDVINVLWRLVTFVNETEKNGQDVTLHVFVFIIAIREICESPKEL